MRTALALGSNVHRRSVFERKHYFYSDLPHGYQITQQRHPLATGGSLPLIHEPTTTPDTTNNNKAPCNDNEHDVTAEFDRLRSIGITRIQLEVDSGKSLHDRRGGGGQGQQSLVDLNRAGTALMEIVFEPEIRGAAEAGAALRSLQLFLRKVGACDGNMEDGSMRCDLNVSVRPAGEEGLGERVEVKNMNSVRHMMTAAAGEALRQARLLELGQGPIERETRGFDEAKVRHTAVVGGSSVVCRVLVAIILIAGVASVLDVWLSTHVRVCYQYGRARSSTVELCVVKPTSSRQSTTDDVKIERGAKIREPHIPALSSSADGSPNEPRTTQKPHDNRAHARPTSLREKPSAFVARRDRWTTDFSRSQTFPH